MNQFNEKASNTSKLSAYWPFVIFQNETQYLKGYGYGNGWTEWDIGPTELTIYDGSSLSIMRTGTNKSELSIFYQNVDGDLMEYQITQNEVKNVVNSKCSLPVLLALTIFFISIHALVKVISDYLLTQH